jgi:hypothetical protein
MIAIIIVIAIAIVFVYVFGVCCFCLVLVLSRLPLCLVLVLSRLPQRQDRGPSRCLVFVCIFVRSFIYCCLVSYEM